MEQLIYTYQTICNSNGKSYIGVHKTSNINDGYIGNGIIRNRPSTVKGNTRFHYAVRKYGFDAFSTYIMCFFDTYEEALEEEKYLVDSDWVKKQDNYNVAIGGNGNPMLGMSLERKNIFINKISGSGNHRYGKKAHNKKNVLKYDLNNKFIEKFYSVTDAANSVNLNPSNISACCIGKSLKAGNFIFRYEDYSTEELNKLNNNLSKKNITYNQNGIRKYKYKQVKKYNRVDFSHSEESKTKMRLAKLGKKRNPHSEETKQKMRLSKLKNNIKNEC